MINKISETENYSLTKIRKKDLNFILQWFNDSYLCKYMEDSNPGAIYNENDFYDMISSKNEFYYSFLSNKTPIGFASIYYINYKNSSAEFSFLIGDPNFRGKGLASALINMIEKKALKLNIKILYCSIMKNNIPSVKTIIKSGYNTIKEKKLHPNPALWNENELHFLKRLV